MKKTFLLVAALCMAMNGMAQDNLAIGATASASSNSDQAKLSNDNDTGTRWAVNGNDNIESGYWWTLDLKETKNFNVLSIFWENDNIKQFAIYTATELDDEDNPKWGETPVYTSPESDNNKGERRYNLGKTVNAQYVKLKALKKGAPNYFSMWEVRLFNYSAEQLATALDKFTITSTNKNYIKVGDTFRVTALDQWQNTLSDLTYETENAKDLGNGEFRVTGTGTVTVTAKYGTGEPKTVTIEGYVPALQSVRVSPAIVIVGEETQLTATGYDQHNETIEGLTIANNGKLTADKAGAVEVIVTDGDNNEVKKTVYAVAEGTTTPEFAAADEVYFDDFLYATPADKNWNGRYDSQEVKSLGDGNKVLLVCNAGTFGLSKKVALTGYTTLSFDIFPSKDISNATVKYEGSGLTDLLLSDLKAGQWNHVDLNIENATSLDSWIQINLDPAAATDKADILLDNIYLHGGTHTESVEIAEKADDRGFYAVKGFAEKAETVNAQLTGKSIAAYDLTGLKCAEGLTLTPANPNAIIIVNGTVQANNIVEGSVTDWGKTKNTVVKDGNYYFPVNKLDFTDDTTNPSPVYTDFFISTGNTGFKYTRSIFSKKYMTVYTPNITSSFKAEVPEGCAVYKFAASDNDGNVISLVEIPANEMAPNAAYIIYNDNDKDVDFVCEGTGDLDLQKSKETPQPYGNLTVNGTFQYFTGDDETVRYGLDASSFDTDTKTLMLKRIGTKAIIAPFRVFFTVPATEAQKIRLQLPSGGTTGISDANAEAANADANIYSIDGTLVKKDARSLEGLQKGIYIMNGKKYVVK